MSSWGMSSSNCCCQEILRLQPNVSRQIIVWSTRGKRQARSGATRKHVLRLALDLLEFQLGSESD
jgi:hypothetical protein